MEEEEEEEEEESVQRSAQHVPPVRSVLPPVQRSAQHVPPVRFSDVAKLTKSVGSEQGNVGDARYVAVRSGGTCRSHCAIETPHRIALRGRTKPSLFRGIVHLLPFLCLPTLPSLRGIVCSPQRRRAFGRFAE